ncbi:pathogen-associated molecular patterns-induced protein A70 [Malania oleifera]|uniref:pathogen-associated molecular patterns-induced protein A70 n=1 Tax=Malania oleifera TaxID=397392 RepID=UPI0025ADF628|nr:pathogen-associated molecular patterns-induced protein A70 [Malania oleifera]
MFEATASVVPSIWASMNSWFTPAVLFVILNIMIGTIAVTSGLGTQKPQSRTKDAGDDHSPLRPQLLRSPSVLQRLKSINLYSYRSPEPTTLPSVVEPTPEVIEAASEVVEVPEPEAAVDDIEKEEEEERQQTMDEVYGMIQGRCVSRVKSDTRPASGESPVRLPQKLKKSASAKSAFAHFEESDVVESRRPATVREGKAGATEHYGEADGGVDARADDFISRFRQQLRLQRLDSIMRYKEMLSRGSEK